MTLFDLHTTMNVTIMHKMENKEVLITSKLYQQIKEKLDIFSTYLTMYFIQQFCIHWTFYFYYYYFFYTKGDQLLCLIICRYLVKAGHGVRLGNAFSVPQNHCHLRRHSWLRRRRDESRNPYHRKFSHTHSNDENFVNCKQKLSWKSF